MDTREDIFLSHVSALACWAVVGHKGLADATKTPVRDPHTSVCNYSTIASSGILDSKFMSKIPRPLDILVPSHERTFKARQVICHLCTRELPQGSLRRLTDHVYVTSPEVTFIQLGTILTDVQLALVGMMLCGSYTIAPTEPRQLIERNPLTTIERLTQTLRDCQHLRGAKTAARALDMCVEGSRSPRESLLFLLACMPRDYGSYELARPELNRKVMLSPAAAAIVGTDEITPDLCWYDKRTLIEYDSWNNHNSAEKLASDDLRIQAFRADSWNAVTLRTHNLNSAERFDKILRNVIVFTLWISAYRL